MYKDQILACVVLNYNDYEQTSSFISMAIDVEIIDYIIIVDNNSPDGSYDLLKAYESDRIKVFKTDHNGGYGYGNNYGVKIAKHYFNADFALICNPDICFEESVVKNLTKIILEDDSIAISAASQINGFTNSLISNWAWQIPTYFDYLTSSLLIISRLTQRLKYYHKTNDEVVNVDCVPGACLLVDVNKFLEIGGYDERVFLFCEESILGFRVKNAGYKTSVLTTNYYRHYHSTSINKNIPNRLTTHKMVLSSRMFYLINYLNVSWFQKAIAFVVFRISIFEYWLFLLLQRLINDIKDR